MNITSSPRIAYPSRSSFKTSWTNVLMILLGVAGLISPGDAEEVVRPEIIKLPGGLLDRMENTPVIFAGRKILLSNIRDDSKVNTDGYVASMTLLADDLDTGERICEFGKGHSFVSGYVDGDTLHAFASRGTNHHWFSDITHFWTTDLVTWHEEPAINRTGDEHLFNTSVCRDDQGYLMAYESSSPVTFCFRFARSTDLKNWKTIPNLIFTGAQKEYSACPVIRYFAPYYYVIYLHAPVAGHNGHVSYITRSKDLQTWELSPLNPVLEAGEKEGTNNSDVDLIEIDRNTYLFYAAGNQANWTTLRTAIHPGPLKQFFEGWFPESPAPENVVSAVVAPTPLPE
ncbi:MAG: hypothetical protein WDZ51_06995 [Pirellulaceae bacterium]